MFKVRDIYWQTARIPKKLIKNNRESRYICYFFILMIYSMTYNYFELSQNYEYLPNYNYLFIKIENKNISV